MGRLRSLLDARFTHASQVLHRGRQAPHGGTGPLQSDWSSEQAIQKGPDVGGVQGPSDLVLLWHRPLHHATNEWVGSFRQYHHHRIPFHDSADAAPRNGAWILHHHRTSQLGVAGQEDGTESSRHARIRNPVSSTSGSRTSLLSRS